MAFKINFLVFDKENKKKNLYFKNIIDNNISFSLLIGPNGTGKSLLLSKIIDIFRDIKDKKDAKSSSRNVPRYYSISYTLDNISYQVKKNGSEYCYNNTLENIKLPDTILALSFLVEDKFTYQSDEHNDNSDMYKYLGIRSTANASFRGSVNKKIHTLLFENINSPVFCDKVVKTFELLDYIPKVTIKFEYNLVRLINQTVTKRTINSKIKKIKESSGYLNKDIDNISENDKIEIIDYIKNVKGLRAKNSQSKTFTKFTIDFTDPTLAHNELRIARKMVLLQLLKAPVFHIEQASSAIDFETLSSGEKNLLYITLNILANASNNSLIIIDEPEISLHPNWQIVYNTHLKKILSNFSNIHIFIATHSHFMVSGLTAEESSIFSLNTTKDITLITDNTYSWSAENILYKVFNTRTVNNYYIESDLSEALSLVTKQKSQLDHVRLNELYNSLQAVVLDTADPLNMVINRLAKLRS